MTDQPNEPLVQVGWYCWRCRAVNAQACRSDCVPVHVPAEWADEMRAEIARREDEDDGDEPTPPQDGPRAPHNGPERPDAGAEAPDGGNGRQTGAGGIPPEIKAIVDRAAGKTHSASGPVMRCLAEVLAAHRQLLLGDAVLRGRLREQYAAAMREHYLCTSRDEADADGNSPCRCGDWHEPGPMGADEDDWDSHMADAVLAVRDREMEQLREQLAARDAALAACTAQLVHDQAALARVRQGLADVITDMRGITGARHWIAALDSVLNPAHDDGPTVADCREADARWWNGEKGGE